jgi:NAD(P)H-flavin reductase
MVTEGRFLPRERLDDLLAILRTDGRRVVGPVVEDGAIRMAELDAASDLPLGWSATSVPGAVRLERGTPAGARAERAFDHGVTWSGIKPWTYPATVRSITAEPDADGGLRVRIEAPAGEPMAVIGARACDLAALAVHDRVLRDGPAADPDYAARRADLVIVAVECAVAASTCFCASMGTGPEVTSGADVVLDELDEGFVVRADTPAGERIVGALQLGAAAPAQLHRATAQVAETRRAMGTAVQAEGLRDRLLVNLDHPRWDVVAERCLACTNCTLVCPTCFCSGLAITSDLDGRTSSATRQWDSCFTAGFAQVAGGSFRPRHRDRYRQWLTHKFATWCDQFGSSGCVGCGRCIAWCPVGIDVREELGIIAAPVTAPASEPVGAPAPPSHGGPDRIGLDYVTCRVAHVRSETADTTTLRLATDDPLLLSARPGQFVMVAVPAFAIPPISISRIRPDGLELTIRAAGPATSFLARLAPGAELALRGPLGRSWPTEDAVGRDVVIVAGGIGLAPLRGLIDALLAERDRYGAIRLYVGARTPADRLFVDELDALAARDDLLVRVTVDRAGPEWLGRVGTVTQLFRSVTGSGENVTAFVCGPERMMSAVVGELTDLRVAPEHLWLTMERQMQCGVGLCGHCQLGSRFVCRDGPVFSVAELGPDLHREGL